MLENKRGIIKIESVTVLTWEYDIKTRQQIVKMILEEIMGFLFSLTCQFFSLPRHLSCSVRKEIMMTQVYTIFQIIMQITFYKIFRWQIFIFSKTNKTFTAIAFYYDQPLVLIWTKFDNKLFGYYVYAEKVSFPLFRIIITFNSKLKMGKQKYPYPILEIFITAHFDLKWNRSEAGGSRVPT